MSVGLEIVGLQSMDREVMRGNRMDLRIDEEEEGMRRYYRRENRSWRNSSYEGEALIS